MIIRNDDVAADTNVYELQRFCELCDRFGFPLLHAITVRGRCIPVHVEMDNECIRALGGGALCAGNEELVKFLQSRPDAIAVHGLYHTHRPTRAEIETAKTELDGLGLSPGYFVPPFNEGDYDPIVCGLELVQHVPRLEDFHRGGIPQGRYAYCHSWRYGRWYKWKELELCLERISATTSSSIAATRQQTTPS